MFALCIFVPPIAILLSILIYLWQKNRNELHRVTAWLAIISGLISPIIGLWGLIHIEQLKLRDYFDFGFERNALKVAGLSLFLALIWLIRSRRWYCVVVFLVSLAVSAFWIMDISTL